MHVNVPENLQKRSILIFGRPIATFYACYCCGYFVFVSFSVLFSLRFALFCFFYFFFFFRFALRPTIVVCLYLMYTIRASDGRARGTARLKTDRL